jgi:WD40 repeat protein
LNFILENYFNLDTIEMSCSFGIASNVFLNISNDSKVHLWDIETRKEKRTYTDKNHLSHEYSCVCWKPGTKEHLGHCVVGYSDGVVVVWDLVRGVVTRTFGNAGQTPSPSSIAVANDGQSIFIGTNESEISQYDIASGNLIKKFTGGKKGTNLMAINPKAAVLAISR